MKGMKTHLFNKDEVAKIQKDGPHSSLSEVKDNTEYQEVVLGKITAELIEKQIQFEDNYIKSVTPKWWQWCITKGGIFRFIAKKLVKVIIIRKYEK